MPNTYLRWMGVTLTAGWMVFMSGCQVEPRRDYQPMLARRIQEVPATQPAITEREAEQIGYLEVAYDYPLRLNQVIGIALSRNPNLESAFQGMGIAEQQILVARSAFFPQISASAAASILDDPLEFDFLGGLIQTTILEQHFWRAELGLQWMLWDFGRSLGRYQQAQLGRQVAELTYRRTRQTIIFRVTEAYFNVLRAEKAHLVASEAVNAARSQLEVAERFFEAELVARSDVLRAQVQVAEFEQQEITAGNAVELARAALNRVMGINVNRPTRVQDIETRPAFDRTLPWALQQAIECRPEFQQVQLAIRVQEKDLSIACAEFMPEVYGAGMIIHLGDAGPISGTLGYGEVGIRMNLFTGGRRTALARQARREIDQAVAFAQEVADSIALEVRQAILGIDESQSRLEVAQRAVALGEKNLRLVLQRYRNALATATDVADAQVANARAQLNFYSALYDTIVSVERLKFTVGTNDIQYARERDTHP